MSLENWERITRRALVNNPVIDEMMRHMRNLWEQAESVSS
jgi:hypothetical protein